MRTLHDSALDCLVQEYAVPFVHAFVPHLLGCAGLKLCLQKAAHSSYVVSDGLVLLGFFWVKVASFEAAESATTVPEEPDAKRRRLESPLMQAPRSTARLLAL
eukprot:6367454-Amphidinium_carterae.1